MGSGFGFLRALPLLVLVACGGDAFKAGDQPGEAGAAGSAGEAGAAGQGGDSGMGGEAGEAGASGAAGDAGQAGAAGSGQPCRVDLQCHHDDPCVIGTCIEGQCSFSEPTPFLVLPDDIQGDCQQLACDENAKPIHQANLDDTGPDGGCQGAKKGLPCAAPEDCPPRDLCSVAVCEGGTCTYSLLKANDVIPDDTTGDCRKPTCDVESQVVYQEDPSDTPAQGQCALVGPACKQAADCPAHACLSAACTDGHCSFTPVPAGPAPGDPKGDCAKVTCDGKGSAASAVDPTDTADDSNECTKAVCVDEALIQEATPGAACGNQGTCNDQAECVECTADKPCSDGSRCIHGRCISDGTLGAVGCADGDREGFLDTKKFSTIAACGGAWLVGGLTGEPLCQRQGGNHGNQQAGEGCGAADLCAEGWHVCRTSAEVGAALPGESKNACPLDDLGAGAFYATAQSGPGGNKCLSGAGQTNDVFGCGNPAGKGLSGCGPLNATLSTDAVLHQQAPFDEGGWGFDAEDASASEQTHATKASYLQGGVLCCRDPG